jgi:hypothetical protein
VCLPSPLQNHKRLKYTKLLILLVVLCGCETLSLTLREEHSLRVSENRVLRRIFGPGREEAAECWRRLHNKEPRKLYASPSIIIVVKSRRVRWKGQVARMGQMKFVRFFFPENLNGRAHLGRTFLEGRIILDWISGK